MKFKLKRNLRIQVSKDDIKLFKSDVVYTKSDFPEDAFKKLEEMKYIIKIVSPKKKKKSKVIKEDSKVKEPLLDSPSSNDSLGMEK